MNKLSIQIDKYFASEIDEDALIVSEQNHKTNILQMGDIMKIDAQKISEIVPIDLILSSPPCNQLSRSNPKRRNLTGKNLCVIV